MLILQKIATPLSASRLRNFPTGWLRLPTEQAGCRVGRGADFESPGDLRQHPNYSLLIPYNRKKHLLAEDKILLFKVLMKTIEIGIARALERVLKDEQKDAQGRIPGRLVGDKLSPILYIAALNRGLFVALS